MNICIVVSMKLGVRAGVDVYDRTCMRTFLCMYICKYQSDVGVCVCMGGVGVLVKVFKKQKQYVSEFQLKFKEGGFCLAFGVGWGWRCPQKKKKKKKKKNVCVALWLLLVWSYLAPCSRVAEPQHDKTNKMSVRLAKTQISLGIRPV